MNQRATTTDQLARVVQTLQLERRTGVLAIERGENATLEEGLLVFVNGQITEAKVGLRYGITALNRLSMWGQCRCSFLPMPGLPPTLPVAGETHTPEPRITRKFPAVQVDTDSGQPRQRSPITQKLPALPADIDIPQPRTTQKLMAVKLVKPGTPAATGQNGHRTPQSTPVPTSVTPYLTRSADEAMHLLGERNLSRFHKHLLLLIDGRRTTLDLMRLMGRTPDEISRLIGDLRYLGLIGLRV